MNFDSRRIWVFVLVVLVAVYALLVMSGCAVVNVAGRDGTQDFAMRILIESTVVFGAGVAAGRLWKRRSNDE